ncbi:transporter substrate-binding domain-containing protein, partial [Mesotoga prima]
MRKAFSIVFFMLLSLTLFGQMKYVFSGDIDYPPFEYENERGIPVGFNVDILQAISRALDFEIEIELRTWISARSALESGQIDGLLGMYYSEGRSLLVDFSNPHTILHGSIFCSNRTEAFSSLNDLRESRVAVQKGDLMDELVTNEGVGSEVVRVEFPEIAMRM